MALNFIWNKQLLLNKQQKRKEMGIPTKENEKVQGPIPDAGQTLAICVGVIDLGTQLVQFKPNAPAKPTKQIYLIWELPAFSAVFKEEKGKQRMVVSQKYTNSLYAQGGFRKMLDSWFGKPIEEMPLDRAKKIPGWPGMAQIAHNKSKDGKITYANIANKGIAMYPLPKGTKVPKPENELIYFDLDEGQFSMETYEKLPKFLKEIIAKSPEFEARTKGASFDSSDEEFETADPFEQGGQQEDDLLF